MNNKVIEYKCPNCGAIIEFNSDSQSMKCPFCDSEFSVNDFQNIDESLIWNTEEFNEYHCESCGAEIIADETTASLHCPYCDSPVILTGRLSGRLKPDYIIPFKYNKTEAINALNSHFKGKMFLPKIFKSQNHLDEIKGIYVPFWLFDTDTNCNATYEMTNTKIWTDTKNQYTETEIYRGNRSGISHFSKVPVDGSKKMSDEMMESIEPYDFNELIKFQSAYLSGYYADKYDVDADDSAERAKSRISKTASEQLDSTVSGYGSIKKIESTTAFNNTKIHYALLPVWILNTTWNEHSYPFAMNGQTGKFVGNLPCDKWLLIKYYGLYTVLFAVILFIISRFLGLGF